MQSLASYEELKNTIDQVDYVLIYGSMPQCSVCKSDFPKVEKLVEKFSFPSYSIDLSQMPKAVGQFSLMTAPIVLIFYQGKEWHRQARIIDFQELEYRIKQIQNEG